MLQAEKIFLFWSQMGLSKDFEGLKTEIQVSGQEMIAFL
jgi:hypothetical protein